MTELQYAMQAGLTIEIKKDGEGEEYATWKVEGYGKGAYYLTEDEKQMVEAYNSTKEIETHYGLVVGNVVKTTSGKRTLTVIGFYHSDTNEVWVEVESKNGSTTLVCEKTARGYVVMK